MRDHATGAPALAAAEFNEAFLSEICLYAGSLMANDAKLGLVLGVAIVLVIGLVFFRADPPLAAHGPTVNKSATATLAFDASPVPPPPDPGGNPPVSTPD